jgi:DNA repair protein RAD50
LRNVKEGEIKQYQTSLLDFQSEVKELRRLTTAVASFRASGKLQMLEDHVEKVATVLRKIQAQQKEKSDLEPQLARASASVENQERYKKLLRDNIALVNEEGKISEISDSIEKLQEEFDGIEGADDAVEKHHEAQALKQKKLGEKARLEGRWMEVVEKVRSMKRKLSADEYKNVDEQHRVASIKHDTTQLASADLKKYYTAVDKALLQYHSVKITVSCAVCCPVGRGISSR